MKLQRQVTRQSLFRSALRKGVLGFHARKCAGFRGFPSREFVAVKEVVFRNAKPHHSRRPWPKWSKMRFGYRKSITQLICDIFVLFLREPVRILVMPIVWLIKQRSKPRLGLAPIF